MGKLLSASQILTKGFEEFERAYKFFLPLIIGALIILIGAAAIAPPQSQLETPTGFTLIRLFMSGILMMFINIFLALTLLISYRDQKKDYREILKKGIRVLPGFLFILFLNALIIFGGFLLLIIPGILFNVWFAFATYTYIFEDKRGLASLLRSKHLVSGYFWAVLWRIIFLGFIGIVSISPFIVVNILFNLEFVRVLQQFWIYIFVLPLMIAYNLVLYRSLRDIQPETQETRREGIKLLLIGIAGIIIIPTVLFGLIFYTLRNVAF